MPYRLKKGETVSDGVRRVVLEEIESATQALEKLPPRRSGEAIHEARKSLKKIRGVLRLIRPELGVAYKREDVRLRDLGRTLSNIRDAQAIIETYDQIVNRYRDEIGKSPISPIRRGLERAKADTERDAGIDDVIRKAKAALRATVARCRKWPISGDGFPLIATGLEQTYRRGRKSLRRAQKEPQPDNFHALRKRVKDHWYHVRLVESVWTEAMEAREHSLKDLETWLGDDHNLVVLCEQVQRDPDQYGGEKAIKLFVALAEREQKELQEKAISLAERIYEEKPGRFMGRIAKMWRTWHGDAMDDVQKKKRDSDSTASDSAA